MRLLVALLVAATAVVGLGTQAAPARAQGTAETYCSIALAPGGVCAGARHSLRANAGCWQGYCAPAAYYWVGVAALDSGGINLYGSWVYGQSYACHSYSGANVLYPLLGNGDAISMAVQGTMYYGTGAPTCGP